MVGTLGLQMAIWCSTIYYAEHYKSVCKLCAIFDGITIYKYKMDINCTSFKVRQFRYQFCNLSHGLHKKLEFVRSMLRILKATVLDQFSGHKRPRKLADCSGFQSQIALIFFSKLSHLILFWCGVPKNTNAHQLENRLIFNAVNCCAHLWWLLGNIILPARYACV